MPVVQQTDEERLAERARLMAEFLTREQSSDDRFAGITQGLEKSKTWKPGELLPSISFEVSGSDEDLLRLTGYDAYLDAVTRVAPILLREVEGRVEREDDFIKVAFGE